MSLSPEVEALIAAQAREIERLRAEVAELRRRLDLDSTTSSKPPSSDGLKKKPRLPGSLRGRSGKASGGQRGHKGDTLRQVSDPDEIVEHQAERCAHCRARLDAARIGDPERRQVFDLPERLLRTTEHRAFVYRCASCGLRTKAEFPAGVISPTRYGERVRAAAVYLNVRQLLPEARTAQALSDLIGAQFTCAASVTGWARDKAQTLEPVYRAIGTRVAEAKVRCLDETGFRIAGKTQWLHATSSERHTVYRVGCARGDVPAGLKGGVVVHDHFRPYAALDAVDHAFCNAHHLRELQALIDSDKEVWALDMRAVLLDAAKAVRQAKEAGESALGRNAFKASSIATGRPFEPGFPSIARCRPSTLRRTRKNDKSSVPATISSSASRPSRTRPCASWSTSTSHAPTTWPNRTCA